MYPIVSAIESGHIFILPIRLLFGCSPFFNVLAFIIAINASNIPFGINNLLFGINPPINKIEKNLSDIASKRAPSLLSAFNILAIFPSKKSDRATNEVTLNIVLIDAPLFTIIGIVMAPISLEKLSQFGINDFLLSGKNSAFVIFF